MSNSTASIPLRVDSTGKKIKVGVQLEEQAHNAQQSLAAVSAGMLRALIQGRFGDDAQLCDESGEPIPDHDIIWARDRGGNVSVKNKLQISTNPTPRSLSGGNSRSASAISTLAGTKPVRDYSQNPAPVKSSISTAENQKNQFPENKAPRATTNTAVPTKQKSAEPSPRIMREQEQEQPNQNVFSGTESQQRRQQQQHVVEINQQVAQRTRQLHVARTLLDTDRLKWNQQLDLLTQLRDIAVEIVAMQRTLNSSSSSPS
jgi:hypothetical protein